MIFLHRKLANGGRCIVHLIHFWSSIKIAKLDETSGPSILSSAMPRCFRAKAALAWGSRVQLTQNIGSQCLAGLAQLLCLFGFTPAAPPLCHYDKEAARPGLKPCAPHRNGLDVQEGQELSLQGECEAGLLSRHQPTGSPVCTH